MSRLIAVAVGGDAASVARRCSKTELMPSWWAGWVHFPMSASPSLAARNTRAMLPDDSTTARTEFWLPETREVIRRCEPEMS